MTPKDFVQGGSAWEIDNDRMYGPKSATRVAAECTVTAIGRKYVHCGRKKFYLVQPGDPYLTEEVTIGMRNYLFPTKEQADDYLLHEKLLDQVKETASRYSRFDMKGTTTKQLTAILSIMNDPSAVETDASSVSTAMDIAGSWKGLVQGISEDDTEVVCKGEFMPAYLLIGALAQRLAAGDMVLLDVADTQGLKEYYNKLLKSCIDQFKADNTQK